MYIFALFRRISFKLGKLLYFNAIFTAVSMDDECSLIALYKKLKKKWKGLLNNSLHADEIKLWLTPSAKQRRNPCSGLPAVRARSYRFSALAKFC